jgi:hypothetical protein
MNYLHKDNKDKEFVDWRDPSRRMEGFLKWLKWRMRYNDLDHYNCNNCYRDATGERSPTGKSMTKEQQYWFSLIFGMTYQSEMAWVIYWNFPDFWNIDINKLEKWNVENMVRQRYARDTKYNKGRIVTQVKSLQQIIGSSDSIEKFFDNYMSDNEEESFKNVFKVCNTFYKYGSMTSWLTCQVLFETAGLQIRPLDCNISDPSNWSSRSGLMYVYNKDDKIEAIQSGVKFNEDEIKEIQKFEKELSCLAIDVIDEDKRSIFSNYLLESHLCQYKKLMLGGDYAGHSSGDHFSRATWLSERWPEVNFDPFFKVAVNNQCPIVRRKRESRELRFVASKTGQMINMHDDFSELPNMYLEMDINPDWFFEHGKYEQIVKDKIDKYAKLLFPGEKENNWASYFN